MDRISKHQYYIEIAKKVALRSTCKRNKIGSIIIDPNLEDLILGTGYNDSLSGKNHCSENKFSCMFEDHCIYTTHAEINALRRALFSHTVLNGKIMYSTHSPCYACIKTIAAFGINTIYYEKLYKDEAALRYAELTGINLIQISLE